MFTTRQALTAIHQGTLEKVVRDLFSTENVLSNIRKEANLVHPTSGTLLEIDIWIPSLNICFEFQDPYHYGVYWNSNYTLEFVQSRDATKSKMLRQRRDTLIEVPIWWDGLSASLGATIHFYRPDLLSSQSHASASPIPLLPSISILNSFIPDVGMLMLATFPKAGDTFTIFRKHYWWLGEKYDGVRFCWHPEHKHFYSRHGLRLPLPAYFRPARDLFFDGEIWFGRGNFVEAIKLGTSSLESAEWALLRNVVFDVVSHTTPFEERYRLLLNSVVADHPTHVLAPRIKCTHKDALVYLSSSVTHHGGEGIIIRKSHSLYELGRSTSLMKLKTSRGDTEGLVVRLTNEKITVKLPNRTQIDLNLPEGKLHEPLPKRGDVVTFTFDHMNNGVPQNPQFERVRGDLSWKEVLQSSPSKHLNDHSMMALHQTTHQHKRQKDGGRIILERFVASKKLDPMRPSTWYALTRNKDLVHDMSVKRLLWSFNNSYITMVRTYFPELKLDPSKFALIPRGYWKLNVNARRKALINYAKTKGFDPLVAANWYTQFRSDFKSVKGIDGIIKQYGTVKATIASLFPEIGIDKHEFRKHNYWADQANRKEFLDRYAKAHMFDPLVAQNWYSTRLKHLLKMGCSSAALKDWKDYKDMILNTYPNIGLDVSMFPVETRHYWTDLNNRRNFFVSAAKLHGLDPLLPDTWYTFPKSKLSSLKKFHSVIHYYPNCDHKKALMDVFPNIGIKEELFDDTIVHANRRWYRKETSV
eukprot:Phypoly_transcript_01190.p1 GENE.Phypoly_transcript_01190~~Phypoly_transcript_01190.p1  ORF type:complete len:754 (+),score=55.74 Phypoly_transcript_01190:1305-3566(+)